MARRLIDRVRAWWPWRDRAAELDEEIAFHLSEEADEQRADGLADHTAREAARRDFGNVGMVREDMREAWGWGPLERLMQDVRYGWRALAAARIVTVVAVLTLTLAIGANTAIFSIVNGLLLRPLPVASPERLVLLSATRRPPSRPRSSTRRSRASSPAAGAPWGWRSASRGTAARQWCVASSAG